MFVLEFCRRCLSPRAIGLLWSPDAASDFATVHYFVPDPTSTCAIKMRIDYPWLEWLSYHVGDIKRQIDVDDQMRSNVLVPLSYEARVQVSASPAANVKPASALPAASRPASAAASSSSSSSSVCGLPSCGASSTTDGGHLKLCSGCRRVAYCISAKHLSCGRQCKQLAAHASSSA